MGASLAVPACVCQPHIPISTVKPLPPTSKPPLVTGKGELDDHLSAAVKTTLILNSGNDLNKQSKFSSIHRVNVPLITSGDLHAAAAEFHLLHPPCSLNPPPLYNPPAFTFSLIFIPLFYLHVYTSPSLTSFPPSPHTHAHTTDCFPPSRRSLYSSKPDHSCPSVNRNCTVNRNLKMLPAQSEQLPCELPSLLPELCAPHPLRAPQLLPPPLSSAAPPSASLRLC